MYEPANNQKLKEVLPKYHCSPVLLRRNADWGGSDPSITSVSLLPLSFYRRNQILKRSLLHLTLTQCKTHGISVFTIFVHICLLKVVFFVLPRTDPWER